MLIPKKLWANAFRTSTQKLRYKVKHCRFLKIKFAKQLTGGIKQQLKTTFKKEIQNHYAPLKTTQTSTLPLKLAQLQQSFPPFLFHCGNCIATI